MKKLKNYDDSSQVNAWERQSFLLLIKDSIYSLRYAVAMVIAFDLFNESIDAARLLGWVAVSISFLWSMTKRLSSWYGTKFAIHPEGFRLQTGLYEKHSHFVPAEKLHELHVSQNWWLRLLSLYHVEWSVQGSASNAFSLTGLSQHQVQRLQAEHLAVEKSGSDVPRKRIVMALMGSKWLLGAMVSVPAFVLSMDDEWADGVFSWLVEHTQVTGGDWVAWFIGSLVMCSLLWLAALGWMTLKMYPQRCEFTSSALKVQLGTFLPQHRNYHLRKIQQISLRESWLGARVPWKHLEIRGSSGDEDERAVTLLANMPEQLNEKITLIFNRTLRDMQYQSWVMQHEHWWRIHRWIVLLRWMGLGTAAAAVFWYLTDDVMVFAWMAIAGILFMSSALWGIARAQQWHSHAFDSDYVYLRRGYFQRSWVILPWENIQQIEWKLTPHAKKWGYSNIVLHTLEEEIDLMGIPSEHAEAVREEWGKHSR